MPNFETLSLSELGIDSLTWMELLTSLEAEFGIQISDEFLAKSSISVASLATALEDSLERARGCRSNAEIRRPIFGQRYVIIDNFLPVDLLAELRKYLTSIEFNRFDSVVDPSIDGPAFKSKGWLLNSLNRDIGAPLQAAMQALAEAVRSHPQIYGRSEQDWTEMSFSFWQYEAGTRLGWHNDAGNGRTGEYIIYLHDEWKPGWGGELMILDEAANVDSVDLAKKTQFSLIEDIVERSSTNLTAIRPRPNRLVMVQAGTCHFINRVDASAGAIRRLSMTGFAARPIGIGQARVRSDRLHKLLDLDKKTI
ncbi:hypothetical protein AT984_20815 [Paucibacter sp. KCTC 42545]|nr:hypothetical protein AT984_20815 [Paucibacter sp. KCTC 42545]